MLAPCPYRTWASAATIPRWSGQETRSVAVADPGMAFDNRPGKEADEVGRRAARRSRAKAGARARAISECEGPARAGQKKAPRAGAGGPAAFGAATASALSGRWRWEPASPLPRLEFGSWR